jgi:thioredoxin reductase
MQRAEHNGIVVRTPRVTRIEGRRGELRFIRFDDGHRAACDGLFFNTGQVQRSALPKRLGCAFREDGAVVTDQRQCTGVPGLYLAGDADKDVQFAIVAAAEGAVAATAINRELQDEDRGEPRRAPPRELLSVKPFRRSSQTRA